MPELPEVETIKRDLEKTIIHKKIVRIFLSSPQIIKEPAPAKFKRFIQGATIKKIIRRGKLLIIELLTPRKKIIPDFANAKFGIIYLTIHLRITGQLVAGEKSPRARVSFLLSDNRYLNYNDRRKLGELRVVSDWRRHPLVEGMGPEPLKKDFTINVFKQRIKNRGAKIKSLLLDQKFIAGIGNIYAAEALFLSGIMPQRRADTLNDKEIGTLYANIRKILRQAIKCRGSSVDTYRDGQGRKGTFNRKLLVYGRNGEPCLSCQTPVKRITLGGRGTYFCEVCQQ